MIGFDGWIESVCSVCWFFFVGEARVLLSIEVASDEPASETPVHELEISEQH